MLGESSLGMLDQKPQITEITPTHMMPPLSRPIRIGMIAMTDLENPNAISGMPFRTAAALRRQGIEILPILARDALAPNPSFFRKIAIQARSIRIRRTPMWVKQIFDALFPKQTRRSALRRARSLSRCTQKNLEALLVNGERIDALFGCCISTALYAIETDLPIIYFSDATAPVIQPNYAVLSSRGDAFREALHDIEHTSLMKTHMAVFAAPIARDSAINDFGMDPQRTRVVAMGANVYPADPESVTAPASPPTEASCEMLIVAADPVRKRVDLATEVAEILRQRGINATLHVVGRGTERSNSSEAVNAIGVLKLSEADDRVRHQELLRDCHLQLLPSLGEAFGIAPCESAHFARPAVVAGAGGLPFVVRDGETGIVMPVDADASAWADSIESLIRNPEHYKKMSIQALDRARTELNWDAWGAAMRSIIAEQIQS